MVTFGYDAAGELTVANGVALSYDGLGRLVGEGGRRFVYDGNDLVAEYGADGSLLARYVHGPGEDEPLVAHDGSGAAHYLLADASGSLVGVTGSGGGLEARTAYDDYGRGAPVSRFGFAGKPWLSGAGVYHWRARAYAPDLGRFLQPDPAGYADGLNLYAYVGNDPVNGRDPSGLERGSCGGLDAAGTVIVCAPVPANHINPSPSSGGPAGSALPPLVTAALDSGAPQDTLGGGGGGRRTRAATAKYHPDLQHRTLSPLWCERHSNGQFEGNVSKNTANTYLPGGQDAAFRKFQELRLRLTRMPESLPAPIINGIRIIILDPSGLVFRDNGNGSYSVEIPPGLPISGVDRREIIHY